MTKADINPELDYRDHFEVLFDKTYMRWFDLEGHNIEMEIESVERGVELTLRGGAKKKGSVIHFKQKPNKPKPKPLVLNVTNAESIAGIHGNRPSGWPGKKIVLYPTVTKCKGKEVGCIRVKPPGAKE